MVPALAAREPPPRTERHHCVCAARVSASLTFHLSQARRASPSATGSTSAYSIRQLFTEHSLRLQQLPQSQWFKTTECSALAVPEARTLKRVLRGYHQRVSQAHAPTACYREEAFPCPFRLPKLHCSAPGPCLHLQSWQTSLASVVALGPSEVPKSPLPPFSSLFFFF